MTPFAIYDGSGYNCGFAVNTSVATVFAIGRRHTPAYSTRYDDPRLLLIDAYKLYLSPIPLDTMTHDYY